MKVIRTTEECTCCADVIKILECINEPNSRYRDYELYKTMVSNEKEMWCYYLLMKGDSFPIVITEEVANKIIKEPELGCNIATNCWFDRWR